MKTHVSRTLSMVWVALALIMLPSCDLLKDADDVDFDATLEETIVVSEEVEGNDVAYTKTITLDATTDPDINKYKSKIEGFTVNKVSYQVVSFFGFPSATFSGTLSFGDASQSSPTVAATINNLNLSTAFSTSQIIDLPINQSDIDKIAALLKEDKAVKIYLNGTLSETPLTSSIRIILDVKVKANAL